MGDFITKFSGLIESGGLVVIILLLLSLAALTVSIVKIIQFQRVKIHQHSHVHAALSVWQKGEHQQALKELVMSQNPLAKILHRAMDGRIKQQPEPLLREEIMRLGMASVEQLRSHLRVLEVVATLSPLLGLLGTVLGMITAFQQLQIGGSNVDPSALSGGIWEALLTTAVGLGVAIPTIAVLNWLESRVNRFGQALESAVTQVFTADLGGTLCPRK